MSHYYEIEKEKLQALEAYYGLPDSMVTRDWETVTHSLDGNYVIIESSQPLDETILQVQAMDVIQARQLIRTPKYYDNEQIF